MIVFEQFSRVKRKFKGHSFWTRGYCVSTVGLDEAKVRRYIKNRRRLTPPKIDMIIIRVTPFKGASTTCQFNCIMKG